MSVLYALFLTPGRTELENLMMTKKTEQYYIDS